MKIFVITTCIIIGLLLLFQVYTTMSINSTQTQPYKVIRVEKDFEIRFYPAATMATITSSAKSYKELGSSGFSKLAGYIFGGNSTQQKIAMTAPVYMDVNDTVSSMSFVMPSEYNKDNLPKPNNSEVKIVTSADEYVAAITFGGFASTQDINENIEKLENALKANSISYYGNFRYLGYNPPYQLFGRKNEIIVSVNKDFN
ncbi:SOUL family heme-binding protein [Flavobacterium sp.]|uniref:SOUL family heme-binding protein n=2 Tax=Flavobacterium sp. TaxID=239 RepID=UPI0039189531